MKKYLAYYSSARVTEVEVVRETATSVVYPDGRRFAKESEYQSYFDTEQEAIEAVIKRYEDNVAKARQTLQRYEKVLEGVKKKFNLK